MHTPTVNVEAEKRPWLDSVIQVDPLTSCLTLQSPAPIREVRSRSLDIRLGDDYSQLLKFQYDINISAQKQGPTPEEDLIITTENNQEPPAAPSLLENRESLDEVKAKQTPPSSPRSPPSPTSPTSPPSPVSPVSPASPASPASPVSPASGPSAARPESRSTARNPEEQQEVDARGKKKDGEEEVATTSSSHVMLMDVCPKTAANSVYAR